MSGQLQLPTKWERLGLIQAARQTLKHLEALPVLTPCAGCAEFLSGYCRRWQDTVPIERREAGCDQFADEIPF